MGFGRMTLKEKIRSTKKRTTLKERMRSTKMRMTFRERMANETRSTKRKTTSDEKTVHEGKPKRRRTTIDNKNIEAEENEPSLSKVYLITSRGPERLDEISRIIELHNWNMWYRRRN